MTAGQITAIILGAPALIAAITALVAQFRHSTSPHPHLTGKMRRSRAPQPPAPGA